MATKKRTTKRKKVNSSKGMFPAKVRVNPRTGVVQVFVSPATAAKVKNSRKPVTKKKKSNRRKR